MMSFVLLSRFSLFFVSFENNGPIQNPEENSWHAKATCTSHGFDLIFVTALGNEHEYSGISQV